MTRHRDHRTFLITIQNWLYGIILTSLFFDQRIEIHEMSTLIDLVRDLLAVEKLKFDEPNLATRLQYPPWKCAGRSSFAYC